MSFWDEAISQWVWNYGAERPDSAWLLSDYDTWHANPHYTGVPQRHPEDYGFDDEENECPVDYTCPPHVWTEDDDIPF